MLLHGAQDLLLVYFSHYTYKHACLSKNQEPCKKLCVTFPTSYTRRNSQLMMPSLARLYLGHCYYSEIISHGTEWSCLYSQTNLSYSTIRPLSAAGANIMLFASLLKAGRKIVVSGILAQKITENTIFHDWAEKLLISIFF